MTIATAIGFFRHGSEMPSAKQVTGIYEKLEELFGLLGATPTYFSASGGMSEGKYKKYGRAFHRKTLESAFAGCEALGLASNPPKSDCPGYDSFLSMGFGFSPLGKEVSICLVAHDTHLHLGSATCDQIIQELANLWSWDYGFGFERGAATMPEVYLVGGTSNRQDAEDSRQVALWYAAYQPEVRRKRIRDIFPYNMIGAGHLAHPLPDGRSLKAFIEADRHSELRPLSGDLWLWKVASNHIESMRAKLKDSGVIICE